MDPQLEELQEDFVSIDARLHPEEANRAVQELLSPAPAVPLIEMPPDGSVTLPGGYIDVEGKLHTDATVRELNGADEEALARPEVGKSLGRFMQLLLQRGVTRVGPYENPSNTVLGSMLLGDRDTLLLAIRRATYGDELALSIECPACNSTLDLKYDLSTDIPMKAMENPLERTFVTKTRSGHELIATLAVGSDAEAILNAGTKSVPELNSLLLSRCLKTPSGNPLGIEGVRRLGIQDRHRFVDELTDRQPGPQYQKLDIECPTCAKEFPLSLTVADLFR